MTDPAYVCAQCGPDPRGPDVHQATRHFHPPAPDDITPAQAQEWCYYRSVCDAVIYTPIPGADYEAEARCSDSATVEVRLSDGEMHPRCKRHVPIMLRAVGRL